MLELLFRLKNTFLNTIKRYNERKELLILRNLCMFLRHKAVSLPSLKNCIFSYIVLCVVYTQKFITTKTCTYIFVDLGQSTNYICRIIYHYNICIVNYLLIN